MANLEEFISENEVRYLDELKQFLRIPSISALPEHKQDVERCARFAADHMLSIGMQRAEALPTAGYPVVYGEWMGAPGRPTVLVYGHYDVQPADPVELWASPPFDPQVRGNELFARGSADDKGQVYMHWAAVDAHMKSNGRLPVNIKFLIEGEEEVGSDNLDTFIQDHRDLLKADLVVVSDTGWFDKGVPSITYGLRGITYVQVDLKTADTDLHSGSYGGAVANPIQVLAEMIAGLKDSKGRITIPGFYDRVRPLSPEERRQFESLPFDAEGFRKSIGAKELWGEEGYTVLERIWARPALDINGIWGGFTGEGSKTVLPARASAKISCRLVPNQDPQEIARLLEARLRELCPPTVEMEFRTLNTGRGAITPIDHPAVQATARAMERAYGKKPAFIRSGGSIPVVASFAEFLGIPSVLMGIGLPDERSHAPNEHLDLGNFFGGIRAAAFLWEELSK
ncbi:MAG TPA: dipeptidase [Chloroflexota bacterium]|nr:dipeptidase [Chloroflexota bacterium]